MPRCPQDIYARHLITASRHGYPLWNPTPSREFLFYRRDGLQIGDVGVVNPEDGCFDVFFNICLDKDHPFHRATGGVPDNFEPIDLRYMDIRTEINAENPGHIIAASSVRTVRTIGRPRDAESSRPPSSGLECEFNLSSSEGALLILPDGAERRDLRNRRRFLEAAARHGADWYRFVEEKVGETISNDSLYLITGLCKTRSWSVAAFEKTSGCEEYPAQCKLSHVGDGIAATYTWDTTRALDWRVGPVDNYGESNQTVFIRGFKIALQTGMFGTKWISVNAEDPCTRLNPARAFGAIPGMSLLAYIFGGTSRTAAGSSGRGTQDEIAAEPAFDSARHEIENNGALAVGEQVVVRRMPESPKAFHPSNIINRYLLQKEPQASIAITHDDDWTAFLGEGLVQPEDLVREGLLETLVSQNYNIFSEEGAVYLQNRINKPENAVTGAAEENQKLKEEIVQLKAPDQTVIRKYTRPPAQPQHVEDPPSNVRAREMPRMWKFVAKGLSLLGRKKLNISESDVVVFVVGPTGSGKSWFTKTVTECEAVHVSEDQHPDTGELHAIRCELSPSPTDAAVAIRKADLQGVKNIVFVDTPAFHTESTKIRPDKEFELWFKNTKYNPKKVGMIYMHRVETDPVLPHTIEEHHQELIRVFRNSPGPLPQRLHVVISHDTRSGIIGQPIIDQRTSVLRTKVDSLQKSTDRWQLSMHEKKFEGEAEVAWKVVEELFQVRNQ